MTDRESASDLRNTLVARCKEWDFYSRAAWVGHVALSIASFTAAALVTLFANDKDHPIRVQVASVVSAFLVAVVNFLGLASISNRYRRAWRKVQIALLQFDTSKDKDRSGLIRAYADAETEIGDVIRESIDEERARDTQRLPPTRD